jgi:hypothetical protein
LRRAGIIHARAMPHRSPHDLARMLAAVRIAAGVTFALTPARAGSVLVGRDARAPGAPGTIATAAVLGIVAVGLAPLLGARRLRHLDIPSTLRVAE